MEAKGTLKDVSMDWKTGRMRLTFELETDISSSIDKLKDKPLFVPLALNAENKAAQKKLDGPISFAGKDTQLLASSPRKLFLEKTEAYNAQVKAAIEQAGQKKA